MKLLIALALIALLSSCEIIDYVQIYKSESENVKNNRTDLSQLQANGEGLFYSDGNCDVYYNLWKEGGDIGFRFHNKTDQNIYLNLDECFFVLNGIAYDYYQNRSYTNSNSNTQGTNSSSIYYIGQVPISISNANGTTQGHSVSFIESKVVCIPARASKIISEFSINKTIYRDCNLFRFPTKNDIETESFTKENSPFVFRNVITYTINNEKKKIENPFYISWISNKPLKEVAKMKYEGFCGDSSSIKNVETFFKASPDKFYIKYSRSKSMSDAWKH